MTESNLSRIPTVAEERAASESASGDPETRSETLRQLLTQPLDPKLVARRKGGKGQMVPYIEGYQVINQANRIFGYGSWGAEVMGAVGSRELTRLDEKTGEVQPVTMYWATVRVRVEGCASRSDVGCGFTAEDSPEAHDTAIKAAVTDAMKRALRQFGCQFGNELYQRGSARRSGIPREVTDLRKAVLTLGTQLGLDATTTQQRVAQRAGRPMAELDTVDLARVLRVMTEALNRGRPAA